MDTEKYTIPEAAEYLGLTYRTLLNHIDAGKIIPDVLDPKPRHRKPSPLQHGGNRYWRFRRQTLDTFKETLRPRLTAEQWSEVARRYHAGEPGSRLCREFGIAPGSLVRRVGPRQARDRKHGDGMG